MSDLIANKGDEEATMLECLKSHLSNSATTFLGKRISSLKIQSLSGSGGFNATINKLLVAFEDGSSTSVVHKTMPLNTQPRSKIFGLPRECLFYNILASKLRDLEVQIPQSLYAHGVMETGEKILVLEDLSTNSIQAGYFFGSGSPHNWGRDLENLTLHSRRQIGLNGEVCEVSYDDMTTIVSLEIAKSAGKMHSTFWMDTNILDYSWLRGNDWIKATKSISLTEPPSTWIGAQNAVKDHWLKTKTRIQSDNTYNVKWNLLLINCIDSSLSKVSWETYVTSSKILQWTLVHGDFHPGIVMY